MKINTRDFEMIGADYERKRDYYLDRSTGKLYCRSYTTLGGYKPGQILVTDAVTVEMVPGEKVLNEVDFERSSDLRN